MISKGPLAHIFVQEHSHLALKLPLKSHEKLFASLSGVWLCLSSPGPSPTKTFDAECCRLQGQDFLSHLFVLLRCGETDRKQMTKNPEPHIPLIFWKNKPFFSHVWTLKLLFHWGSAYSQSWRLLISFSLSCKEETAITRPLTFAFFST